MGRQLKIHLLRPAESAEKSNISLCGIVTESSTEDPEQVSCKHCSGFYRTNMEWYSQVHNKALEARGRSGEDDLYTRRDIEAGLMRLGWSKAAVFEILTKTNLFRDVFLASEVPDPWAAGRMGVRIHGGGQK